MTVTIEDHEEAAEMFTQVSTLRDKVRDDWKICTDPEKAHALKHLGIALKKMCEDISLRSQYHQETWETIQTRSEILIGL